jgi:hypothetical protein
MATGSGFIVMATLTALLGAFLVIPAFQNLHRAQAMEDETVRIVGSLLGPVAFGVCGFWLLFRIGQGLRRFLTWSRWTAVGIFILACLPPLTYFFSAVRAGARDEAAWMAVLALPLALGAILLTSAETDLLFDPKHSTTVVKAELHAQQTSAQGSLVGKLLVTVITLAVILLVIALRH